MTYSEIFEQNYCAGTNVRVVSSPNSDLIGKQGKIISSSYISGQLLVKNTDEEFVVNLSKDNIYRC